MIPQGTLRAVRDVQNTVNQRVTNSLNSFKYSAQAHATNMLGTMGSDLLEVKLMNGVCGGVLFSAVNVASGC
jgi:hypothetical protein